MSKRISDLLQEMQGIFGNGFGHAMKRLAEDHEFVEAQRPMPKGTPSKKGVLAKKKGGMLPARGGKHGLTLKAKRALKAREKENEKRYQDVMKHIRGEMDKSQKKAAEKKAAKVSEKPSVGTGGGGHAQNPFRHAKTIGIGPRKHSKRSETKCWSCKCKEGTYSPKGCTCTSSGRGKNCPPAGTVKMIKIKETYHQKYNRDHHKCTNDAGVKIDCGSHGRR